MPKYQGPYWIHSAPADQTPETAAPIPCPGWHNDSWRYTEDPAEDHDHPDNYIHGEPVWCARCTDKLRAALAYMPTLADNLLTEIDDATTPPGERVSGTKERAIHRHQAHAFLLDQIRDVLAQWEDEVRAWRGFSPRRTGMRQIPAIRASAAFLAAHLDWTLTKAPDTHDAQGLVRAFVDKVHLLDRRGMFLTQRDEPKPEPCVGVRCKACSYFALVRSVDRSGADQDEIRCENCAATMTVKQYRDWAAQWAIYEHAHLAADAGARDALAGPVAAYERARGTA